MESLFKEKFTSLDAAHSACDQVARNAGFALAIRNKKPNAKDPRYVLLRCSQGRKPLTTHDDDEVRDEDRDKKRCRSTTQMKDCPFRVILKLDELSGCWVVSCTPESSSHNHKSAPPMAHRKYRGEVVAKYKNEIVERYNNGTRPLFIATQLREKANDPDLASITNVQVHNALCRHRRDELNGRTPIQFLYDQLKDPVTNVWFCDQRNTEGRLLCLFIAPRSGVDLLRRYPHVLLLDCTYKTNRFNMPLLNICGATSAKKTFSVASIFLDGEKIQHYFWALRQLLQLLADENIPFPRVTVTDRDAALIKALRSFPQLKQSVNFLCKWHINQNVLAKCKSHFPRAKKVGKKVVRAAAFTEFLDEWKKIVCSTDEATFFQLYNHFKNKGYPAEAITYVDTTWIGPWKEKFASCWVDQHRHLGHTTTSIVEGVHVSMKRFLWSSTGDLATVFQRFRRFWSHQKFEVMAKEEMDKVKISTFSLKPVYSIIREKVSSQALKLLEDEHRKIRLNFRRQAQRPEGHCPCGFTTSHGLPCRHILFERIQANNTLILEDFDSFWHTTSNLDQDLSSSNAPLDPLVVRSKGRPKGSLNMDGTSRTRSTRRDPSHFEYVERDERAEAIEDPIPLSTALTKTATKKRGFEFIEEYGDGCEPGTQMQRGYQRAIRRSPGFNDETCENPTQIDLTCDSDPDKSLQEAPPQEVLQKSELVDKWAEWRPN